jgi:response regulator RpfG family c-di-GMP phosphodiesterase
MNHRPHILIVCDTADDKSVLQDVLADLAEVSFGNSGKEEIRNAQTWQPELMVLGATLADMAGTQALVALKKDPRTASIPVLLMTERGDADAESRLLLQGASDVLHTPLRAEVVRSKVQLHLNFRRHARRLHAAEQLEQHVQQSSELLDDLLATAQLAARQAAAGLPVEPHFTRLLATGQQLKRTLAPGRETGDAPMPRGPATAPAALQASPSNMARPATGAPPSSARSAAPPPSAPLAGTSGEDHLWLPLDPQDPQDPPAR